MSDKVKDIIFLILSAFLYGLNVPISKYYLNDLSSNELLFLLYFGASLGMALIILFNKNRKSSFILDKKNEVSSFWSGTLRYICFFVYC